MSASLAVADRQVTPEFLTQRVRRQLDADCDLGRFQPCPATLLDQVAAQSVHQLWDESRIKTFVPVLALRQAREALHDCPSHAAPLSRDARTPRDGNEPARPEPPRPVLVLVTGLSATGKTPLAEALAEQLAFPCFRKDAFKEALFDVLGWSDKDWSDALDDACYELLWRICDTELRAGRSLILESDFQPAHAPRLHDLSQRYGALALEVHCRTERHVLVERFRERVERGERHPGHPERSPAMLYGEALPELWQAPDPLLGVGAHQRVVDTTDGTPIDTAAIAAWVRQAIAPQGQVAVEA